MYEVELKVRADHDAVRNALEERGAEHLETLRQVDTYYHAPHRDFAATDEALRIRREHRTEGVQAKLTYKGPRIDEESKTRAEYETTVADGETTAAIFESLGFSAAATVEKERARYAVAEAILTLDDVTDLGEFVEIETDVESKAALERTREDLAETLAELGLESDEQIRTSYLGLLLDNSE